MIRFWDEDVDQIKFVLSNIYIKKFAISSEDADLQGEI